MQPTYYIRVSKAYAADVIEDLQKMHAIELLDVETGKVPEWQKNEVRKCADEIKENPSILVGEDVVFEMLKEG